MPDAAHRRHCAPGDAVLWLGLKEGTSVGQRVQTARPHAPLRPPLQWPMLSGHGLASRRGPRCHRAWSPGPQPGRGRGQLTRTASSEGRNPPPAGGGAPAPRTAMRPSSRPSPSRGSMTPWGAQRSPSRSPRPGGHGSGPGKRAGGVVLKAAAPSWGEDGARAGWASWAARAELAASAQEVKASPGKLRLSSWPLRRGTARP